jgi:hypothetical protein
MLLALALVVLTMARGKLTPAGALSVFLVATVAWAVGGWTWAVPLVTLYVIFLYSMPRDPRSRLDMREVVPTTVGSMIVVLAFAHAHTDALFVPFLATLSANGAIALALLATARQWPAVPLAISGACGPLLPVLLYAPDTPLLPLIGTGLIGLIAFLLLARTRFKGRRMVASLLAGVAAWALLVPPGT